MRVCRPTTQSRSCGAAQGLAYTGAWFSRFEWFPAVYLPAVECSGGKIMSSRRALRVSQGITNSTAANRSQRPGTASAQLTARLSGRWVAHIYDIFAGLRQPASCMFVLIATLKQSPSPLLTFQRAQEYSSIVPAPFLSKQQMVLGGQQFCAR